MMPPLKHVFDTEPDPPANPATIQEASPQRENGTGQVTGSHDPASNRMVAIYIVAFRQLMSVLLGMGKPLPDNLTQSKIVLGQLTDAVNLHRMAHVPSRFAAANNLIRQASVAEEAVLKLLIIAQTDGDYRASREIRRHRLNAGRLGRQALVEMRTRLHDLQQEMKSNP